MILEHNSQIDRRNKALQYMIIATLWKKTNYMAGIKMN